MKKFIRISMLQVVKQKRGEVEKGIIVKKGIFREGL